MINTINPATEEIVGQYEEHDQAALTELINNAARAFVSWRESTSEQRSRMIRAAADVLRKRQNVLAPLMSTEMGKPIRQAEAEIEKCALVCEYYAENAATFLRPESACIEEARAYVRFDPLGPVLAIMPWNFPFWQVFRFAAPALMAGNVGILKHASNVTGCALAIEAVFRDVGFPSGVFATALVGSDRVSEMIQHPTIRAVTLTGSEAAGSAVAAEAGKEIKKSVLELGGSDPFIVLADADVENVVKRAVKARTINSGQSCIAAKRFIVDHRLVDRFAASMAEAMKHLVIGDPLDALTEIGPLARADLCDELDDQVQRSVRGGASLLLGGERLAGKGFYYAPTVLADVRSGMAAFNEETFGPVAAIIAAESVEHAIELANQSSFGLGASVWTSDTAHGERLAERIECGCVFVNEIVKSDPRLPFGGVKRSGYGRELAEFGIREFTNAKSVWVHNNN